MSVNTERMRRHFRTRDTGSMPHSWNANVIGFDHRTGKTKTDVRIKWLNYAASVSNGEPEWVPINTEFRSDGHGRFLCSSAPIQVACPASATSEFTLASGCQWDIFRKTSITADVLELQVVHPGASAVPGIVLDGRTNQVVYSNALGDGVDIVFGEWHGRGPRAEIVYVFRREPSGDSEFVEIVKHVRPSRGKIPGWNGVGRNNLSNGGSFADEHEPMRGLGIRKANAWYYDAAGQMVTRQIELTVERASGGWWKITKRVPRAFIREAIAARPGGECRCDTTTTVYPDANVETTTHDAWMVHSAAISPFSTIRNAASATSRSDSSASADSVQITSGSSNGWTAIRRYTCLFDPRSIDDTDTISSAVMSVYMTTAATTDVANCKLGVVTTTPASNTANTATDYAQFSGTLRSNEVNFSSITGAGYVSLTLSDLSPITPTSIAKLGLRESAFDRTGSAPAWPSFATSSKLQFYHADDAGTSRDPKLVIEHAAAASGKPTHMLHLSKMR